MKVLRISIKNILGLESLEITPGSITEITGENGSGKTSCLEAIRAALGGGHDATLLRQGAESGDIVLLLEDGTEISKHITAEKSDISVKHPAFGKISKPATYLKKLADALSLNPIQFLTAGKKDRVDQLLQAIPMQVTADQLGFVPAVALAGISLDSHALEVIGKIGRAVYDLRTGVNRSAHDKRATAGQMTETLPAEAEEGDWRDELSRANAEYRSMYKAAQSRVASIRADAKAAVDAHKELFLQHKDAVHEELEAAIGRRRQEFEEAVAKLKADAEIEISRSEADRDKQIAESEQHGDEALKAAESEMRPQLDALTAQISKAKTMVEQHAKAESAREFVAQLTKDAETLEAEAARLTHALGRLEILKASLLEKLPIKGLEVRDGDIHLDGIPFDRVNESRRIRLAIEIAKLRAGDLGLVAVDGLERLDPKTFQTFKKEAAKSNLQFVLSRVTGDDKLSISTEGSAA